MKKTFLLFIFLMLFIVNTKAQISNNVLGCILGKSTKAECFQKLESRGAEYYEDNVYLANPQFIGVRWAGVMFFFSKTGKLSNALFLADYSQSKWNTALYHINKNYSKFFKKNDSSTFLKYYSDKKQFIELKRDGNNISYRILNIDATVDDDFGELFNMFGL